MTKKLATLAAALLLVLSTVCATFDAAEAARMGGGRSFGSRPSFSQPAQRQQTSGFNQSKPATPAQQPGVSQAAPARGGMFGRFGGVMGGLLAGSLLGALFFGMPFGGGGMMDFLLIGVLILGAVMVFRMIAARRRQAAFSYAGTAQSPVEAPADQGSWGGSQWDKLRSAPASGHANGQADSQARPGSNVPGFNEDEFLRGAKMVYTRLQASWDARDLEDIREFTSPEVYAEIARQAAQDPTPSTTEILLVNARLLEVKPQGAQILATVYFDVLMREDKAQNAPGQVREVWHFLRENDDPKSSWKLEGIQQLED
ncbi:MAG: Tim44-like domain-containing protein [Desulfocurvibacter africanus]